MNIITNRLILRPFNENDAKEMYKNWTYDERVAKYCRWYPHPNIEATEQLLEMYLNDQNNGFKYRWGITLKSTNELIGCIDAVDISDNGKTATMGYLLSYEYWNKGYITEALKAVINRMFADGFTKIQAEHHIENPASGSVMKKCGMKFVKYRKAQRKFGSDELCETKLYEITK